MQRKWHKRGRAGMYRTLDITNSGKGGESMAEKTYAGKIGNGGAQHVKAPFTTDKAKKGSVKTGNDLRVKGGK